MEFERDAPPAQHLAHLPIVDRLLPPVLAGAVIWITLLTLVLIVGAAVLVRTNITVRAEFTVVPADDAIVLRSPLAGTLREVHVEDGARVEVGQTVLELETADLMRRHERSLAERHAASLEVEALEHTARHSLLLLGDHLNRLPPPREPSVEFRLATTQRSLAELKVARGAALRGPAPTGAPSTIVDPEARRLEAVQVHANEGVGLPTSPEEIDLERMEVVASTARSNLAKAQVALHRIDAEVEELARDIARSRLAAPHAGTVTYLRHLKPGSTVTRGEDLSWIVPDTPSLAASTLLPASACDEVRPGATVTLEVRAALGRDTIPLTGHVIRVAREPGSPTKHCNVQVRLPAASPVTPGAGGEASFVVGEGPLYELFLQQNR